VGFTAGEVVEERENSRSIRLTLGFFDPICEIFWILLLR